MKEFLDPKLNKENLSELSKNVREVFVLCPELAEIGSPEEYEKYIGTIFPESKLKNIVWHGTDKNFKDEGFKKGMSGYNLSSGRAFFFSPSLWRADQYSKSKEDHGIELTGDEKVYAVVLDMKSPKETFVDAGQHVTEEEIRMHKEHGHDALFLEEEEDDSGRVVEYVVFEPEQIHILGSQSDIQRFKGFVSQEK